MKLTSDRTKPQIEDEGQAGFTLIEAACALVIILIALLGVVFAFTYAVNYNAGNSSRSQALAALQQEVEQLRADLSAQAGYKVEALAVLIDLNLVPDFRWERRAALAVIRY